MKKSFISKSLLLCSVLALGSFAMAKENSGTIRFLGTITGDTCDVEINGVTGGDGTVMMGNHAASQFTGKGTTVGGTAGDGAITIVLKNCPIEDSQIKTTFSGDIDASQPTILNTTQGNGKAENVGVQIYTESNTATPIDLLSASLNFTADATGENSYTYNFIAKYVQSSDDEVLPGRADATLGYKITYD